jgi:hypothetical protein
VKKGILKMKSPVMVPAKVDDLVGLLIDLKNSSFLVQNVGADQNGTRVWLEEGEEKDPSPIVESWAGKKPPPFSDTQAWTERRDALQKAEKKTAEVREAVKAGQPVRRPGLFSKVFRRLW